jgi:uncharacterized protein YbjQ (UPF0145 family)
MLFNHNHQTNNTFDSLNALANDGKIITTGISGNELYCAALCGYTPGDILLGNCVYSIGYIGGFASNFHATFGGEIPQVTSMVSEGRRLALERFEKEMLECNAIGASGVTSEAIFHQGNVEFISVGSSLYMQGKTPQDGVMTTSANVQDLYCQIDAGYQPHRLAFGNVAYSLGFARNLLGSIKQITHGEVGSYTQVFQTTRDLALERICEDARQHNANAVVGINTSILSIGNKGIREMMMIGTSSYNPQVTAIAEQVGGIITSDLTSEEMWGVTKLGYAPMQLVLGTSVYSLGVYGGLKAALRSIAKGEINTLTQLVYEAREKSLKKVQDQAESIGADMLIGTKTYIYDLENNLIEFLAIGTAIKKTDNLTTQSQQLPPQAIVRDRDTYIDPTQRTVNAAVDFPGEGGESDIASEQHEIK